MGKTTKDPFLKRAEFLKRLRAAEVDVAKLRLELASVDEKLAATSVGPSQPICW